MSDAAYEYIKFVAKVERSFFPAAMCLSVDGAPFSLLHSDKPRIEAGEIVKELFPSYDFDIGNTKVQAWRDKC